MKKNFHIIIVSFLFSIILWVSISLSNDFYATFEFPVKLTDFPEGYATGSLPPQKISVKIKGKGWKLIAVNLSSDASYFILVGNKSGKRTVNLYNYLVENQWLTSDVEVINISPDTLSFLVEKISYKKLPIKPELNLNFHSGYGLASKIIVDPESTLVYGPASYLSNMDYVPTESVDFENLDNKTTETVSLKNIYGMKYPQNKIKVTLDVQKIVDKNLDNLFVQILDVPKDRNVLLLPNRVSVAVRGGINILGKLDTSQVNCYVNYREVVLDTLGSVEPHIITPDNTTLLFVKPERLRYIIKKF